MEQDAIEAKQLSFEKTRLEYCQKIFEMEENSKERLESKVQFYISFITIILGSVLFNIKFFEPVSQAIFKINNNKLFEKYFWVDFIYISGTIWLIFILIAILSLLYSMRLQNYKNPHPKNPLRDLYFWDSSPLGANSEIKFISILAEQYSLAAHHNSGQNKRKRFWVTVGFFSTVLSVIPLAIYIWSALKIVF
ncbi:hypothetical protein F7734_49195 [Scytonema sp. UIC 10036]|uniref:hypothetical protein n=1 Tax=Scytonema sp. UIC 10036 TaxID=2304196 RepID=UPI0012DA75EA|nr:hypothetical protein [Scytonema sp. UIC 10036]MUG99832.1 hypothetical protein [Scytonema sp. UIC 10036]